MTELLDMRTNVMCNWLFQQQLEKQWIVDKTTEGIIMKKTRDDFVCCPRELPTTSRELFDAVKRLNVKVRLPNAVIAKSTDSRQCTMTVNTRIIKLFLRRSDVAFVPLDNNLRIQVISNITQLPQCQKHHFAAFVQEPRLLVVWDDDPNEILKRVQDLEDQLISMIWKEEAHEDDRGTAPFNGSKQPSRAPSMYINQTLQGTNPQDEESLRTSRPIILIQAILTAITLVLLLAAIGSGLRWIAIEIKVDKNWLRLAFVAVIPLQCWLALFFMQTVAVCFAQILGPISQLKANTKFFSGRAPPKLYRTTLPHVTIQCPVYKEGLWSVIDPTVKSVKAAISTYEMQGGSANIFVNDDGMQTISPEQAQERRDYYDEHNIGWVARPKHNPKPAGGEERFVRAGKFKKASNMNYALNVSIRVEEKLAVRPEASEKDPDSEQELYDAALADIILEDKGRTWAAGNIRIGDYFLLIDSDTRVPTDCFLSAVSEMELCPSVAIIQFSSGVMNVTTSWFEQGITFFTNLIYTAIAYAVSNGDVAPFVGHNAFIRWSAVQDVAYTTASDPTNETFWSEGTVSEDFDMALRLQTSGYILRLAAYAGQGFKEGVSLTVYDELARWEKYAYGCSELIFHPFVHWPTKGPFTPLFRRFITSSMPLPSKLTIMAYIGTYYALASAWLLTLLNYCLVGWFNGHLDHYYTTSFRIYFAIVIVFSALGNVSLAILRYRTEERGLLSSLLENLKWVPLLTVFLGGISLHVSQAILCHLFSIDMSWGATSKEASNTTFFKEIPVILRKFRFTFLFCAVMAVGMVVLAGVGPFGGLVPYDWQIRTFTAVWPLVTVVGKS